MSSVLLIEDELTLLADLHTTLAGAGFDVHACSSGRQAIAAFTSMACSIVILDWMLPDIDGLLLLRHLRAQANVPILMLTARDSEAERVLGLESGADDYLVKPFSSLELIARIRAVLRRTASIEAVMSADRRSTSQVQVCGPLTLEPLSRRVTLSGVALDLSEREFALLELLLRHPGRAFSRRYLIETLWAHAALEGERSIDNAVLRLRRKLGTMASMLETVRGHGYRWKRYDP